MTETATALAELKATWAEFQKANDEALKQKADTGNVDALVTARVEKLNAAISSAEDKLRKRVDDLERRVETRGLYGAGDGRDAAERLRCLDEFSRLVTTSRRSPVPIKVTPEQFQAYRGAWNQYVRYGDKGLGLDESAALQVGSQPDGGYWVMPDMGGRVIQRIFETSPMRQICGQQTISTDALEGVADNDEAGSGWVGETTAPTETTTPTVDKWRIPVHIQYAEPRATQQLLDDAAVDVESWLGAKVANKFARTENTAFVSGNGIGKPRGFLAGPTPVSTADASRAWGTLQYIPSGASGAFVAAPNGPDCLLTTIYSVKAELRMGAAWVMSKALVSGVRKLKDNNGYIWSPGMEAGQPSSLYGYPVVEAEDMPALAADSLSIAFGNFREGYLIVDRQGIVVLRDPFTAKPYVKFYTTKRVGGDVVNSEAIKLVKFATT